MKGSKTTAKCVVFTRRAKAEVLERFAEGLRQADVPGAGWDTAGELREGEADVDALIASATQQKARPCSHTLTKGCVAELFGFKAFDLLWRLPGTTENQRNTEVSLCTPLQQNYGANPYGSCINSVQNRPT